MLINFIEPINTTKYGFHLNILNWKDPYNIIINIVYSYLIYSSLDNSYGLICNLSKSNERQKLNLISRNLRDKNKEQVRRYQKLLGFTNIYDFNYSFWSRSDRYLTPQQRTLKNQTSRGFIIYQEGDSFDQTILHQLIFYYNQEREVYYKDLVRQTNLKDNKLSIQTKIPLKLLRDSIVNLKLTSIIHSKNHSNYLRTITDKKIRKKSILKTLKKIKTDYKKVYVNSKFYPSCFLKIITHFENMIFLNQQFVLSTKLCQYPCCLNLSRFFWNTCSKHSDYNRHTYSLIKPSVIDLNKKLVN